MCRLGRASARWRASTSVTTISWNWWSGRDLLTVASFHRVLLVDGRRCRVDQLRAGDVVSALGGAQTITAMRRLRRIEVVYQIAFAEPVFCAIGGAGIWTFMPEASLPLARRESVLPFAPEMNACQS